VRRQSAPHTRSLALESGGTILLLGHLDPLSLSESDRAFLVELLGLFDRYPNRRRSDVPEGRTP